MSTDVRPSSRVRHAVTDGGFRSGASRARCTQVRSRISSADPLREPRPYAIVPPRDGKTADQRTPPGGTSLPPRRTPVTLDPTTQVLRIYRLDIATTHALFIRQFESFMITSAQFMRAQAPKQRALVFRKRGGPRPGAGRKPAARSSVPHRERPELNPFTSPCAPIAASPTCEARPSSRPFAASSLATS